MARFAATTNALKEGLETASPEQGTRLIDDWIEQLQGVDKPGTKGVLRDLETLKRELERDQPRDESIRKIVARLGEATVKAADRLEGGNADKLRDLGSALTEQAKGHAAEPADDDEDEAEETPARGRSGARG